MAIKVKMKHSSALVLELPSKCWNCGLRQSLLTSLLKTIESVKEYSGRTYEYKCQNGLIPKFF